MDIVITIPKKISWDDYRRELIEVEGGGEINFKVSNFPKHTIKGERCYVVHRGQVRGFMDISGFEEKDFVCSVTGQSWKGKFIARSGPFFEVKQEIKMKGFQGWRYFSMEDYDG